MFVPDPLLLDFGRKRKEAHGRDEARDLMVNPNHKMLLLSRTEED